MLKKYFNSSDERKLKEQSAVMFNEITNGVFYVEKDRFGEYSSYVKSEEVVEALNNKGRVSLIDNNCIYANFELV